MKQAVLGSAKKRRVTVEWARLALKVLATIFDTRLQSEEKRYAIEI